MTIEYHGGPYCGWQAQDGQPTVQGEIEAAIKKFCQQDIRIHAAGRTDTGVHAGGQVAHFDLITARALKRDMIWPRPSTRICVRSQFPFWMRKRFIKGFPCLF